MTHPINTELFAEIGRLNILLNERDKEISALNEILEGLRKKGLIDGLNRPLPLEGHHKDCAHGKDGMSYCSCDELKKADVKTLETLFNELAEEQEAKPARHLRTPDGKPLLPARDFSRAVIEDNRERGLDEDNFQRQSGRTTAMVIQTLEFFKSNTMGGVVIDVHSNRMKKHIRDLLRHYADELDVAHRDLFRVFVVGPKEFVSGIDIALRLRDNALDITKDAKPTRDSRQDLKVGDIVRFELTGVITARQTAGIVKDYDGNDYEPIQYEIEERDKRIVNYVSYHHILSVVGKEE